MTKQRTSSDAAFKAFTDRLLRQIAADEDDAAIAFLAFFPRPLMVAVEDHVHALEDEAVVVVLERQDALAAQDVRTFGLHQVLHPWEEFVRVERLIASDRHRLHFLVVIMLEGVLVAAVMVMIILGFEKFRLDIKNAVEIEGV